ncbi:MAG: histidine ammonia-lyase [Anaerolineales bacterium]
MSENTIKISGSDLTLQHVHRVAREDAKVALDEAASKRVADSAARLADLTDSDQTIYGVNTGFGIFADRRIDASESAQLSTNLILSHAAGVGPPFAPEVVRAAMLIRANTLAVGHSGVRPIVIQTLLEMLNRAVVPVVPSQGSLGSSGDLAPLAHLALVMLDNELTGDSQVSAAWYRGKRLSGQQAMAEADIRPLRLGPKEGLALTNGATFSAALLALSVLDIAGLFVQAEISAAMSLEALLAVPAAFDARLHASRPHPGQSQVAARIRRITEGSTLLGSGPQVQDAYSLRCIPQIYGPGVELLDFVAPIASREINAATDNPLLYGDEVLSGGNFHGQPLGLAADYLKLPLAETGALAERRIFRLTSAHTSHGLPAMLVPEPEQAGLQSGLMMLQYTAASLALENQTLAAADSIRSLPTSAGQEDLNANSTTALRHLRMILMNVRRIIAIELITAAQALDLRVEQNPSLKPGKGSAAALEAVRNIVSFTSIDRPQSNSIEAVSSALSEGVFKQAVEDQIGDLPFLNSAS